MEHISVDEIMRAIEEAAKPPSGAPAPFKIYTSGTGVPDDMWIDFYKDIDQIIVDRNGHEWNRGKRIDDDVRSSCSVDC